MDLGPITMHPLLGARCRQCLPGRSRLGEAGTPLAERSGLQHRTLSEPVEVLGYMAKIIVSILLWVVAGKVS